MKRPLFSLILGIACVIVVLAVFVYFEAGSLGLDGLFWALFVIGDLCVSIPVLFIALYFAARIVSPWLFSAERKALKEKYK